MNNFLAHLHQSLVDKNLGDEGAAIITKVLLQQIEDREKEFQPSNPAWEIDVLNALRLCGGVEEGSKKAQVYVLSLIKRHWDSLSKEFRKQYNYNFDVLVTRETKLDPSTFDNYFRAADTFFIKKKAPMGKVEVPVYDQYRKPVMNNGKVVTKLVDFDPTVPSLTKLNVVRAAVEQDRMTPAAWSALMDTEVTVDALNSILYTSTKAGKTTVDPSLKFSLEGDRLVAKEFGESIEIGEIYFDNLDCELGRTALRRLLLILNIKVDEDEIAKAIQQAHNQMIIRLYENGGSHLISGGKYDK